MKNAFNLKTITFVLFLISYLWGFYVLLDHGRPELLIFLAVCCFSSLLTFLYSLIRTVKS